MKIFWRGRNPDLWGNSKGYNVHNENMLNASVRAGLEFAEIPEEADICFQIAVPTAAIAFPGKKNVLFTMYEMDSIPESWIEPINQFDMLIVPCRHNVRIFRKHFSGPIEVCQEGIDPEIFQFHQRSKPAHDERFKYLWVGATNPRKGYEIYTYAAEIMVRNLPHHIVSRLHFIFKTTRADGVEDCETQEILPEGVAKGGGALLTIDRRRLPTEKLVELYNKCHAFVLPSFGEGWGLTLCEAQATGLPCVYTPWSGPNDFMKSSWSYPAKFKLAEQQSLIKKDGGETEVDHRGNAAIADPAHVAERMVEIAWNYDKALRNGRRGSNHIRSKFTWDIAGERLVSILQKFARMKVAA